MSIIAFSSAVGPIPITCTLSEQHDKGLEITANPIETGAEVNDHAYLLPKRLVLEIADANAVATWAALDRLMASRVPFTIVTGLEVYKNMLINAASATRDQRHSRILRGSVELQEILIVDTSYATNDEGSDDGETSGKPGGEKSTRSAKPSSSRTKDAATKDRAAGTVQRGDAPAKTVDPAKANNLRIYGKL